MCVCVYLIHRGQGCRSLGINVCWIVTWELDFLFLSVLSSYVLSAVLSASLIGMFWSVFVPAAFSPGGIGNSHNSSMTCRSISSLANADVKAECESSGQTPNFSVDSIDVDANKWRTNGINAKLDLKLSWELNIPTNGWKVDCCFTLFSPFCCWPCRMFVYLIACWFLVIEVSSLETLHEYRQFKS